MKNQVMIYNNSSFSLQEVYGYLAGFTTLFTDYEVKVDTERGHYYDTIHFSATRI